MKTLKKIKNQGFDLTTKSIYSIKGGMPGAGGSVDNDEDRGAVGQGLDKPKGGDKT